MVSPDVLSAGPAPAASLRVIVWRGYRGGWRAWTAMGDLCSGGHERDAVAMTGSDRIRWSWYRQFVPNAPIGRALR